MSRIGHADFVAHPVVRRTSELTPIRRRARAPYRGNGLFAKSEIVERRRGIRVIPLSLKTPLGSDRRFFHIGKDVLDRTMLHISRAKTGRTRQTIVILRMGQFLF